MNSSSLAILFLLGLILTLVLVAKPREHFTIAERHGLLCDPRMNQTDAYLNPNSISFVVQGYNYQTTPVIIRDGVEITPLQYFWDHNSMAYYFVVYAPKKLDGSEWIIQTYDFVEPVVNDGVSGAPLKVTLLRRRDGFNWWTISK
jgi:hypothetical protein